MSLIGILSSNLFSAGNSQDVDGGHASPNNASRFQQIKAEFQQLGQDLQSGNLTQAQADYTTLSKILPGLAQSQNSANSLAQAFNQLGQDLQAGNLQAAQSDYATVQQDARQSAAQAHGHRHHHHHSEGAGESGSSSPANPIVTAFSTLAKDLQAEICREPNRRLRPSRTIFSKSEGSIPPARVPQPVRAARLPRSVPAG